MATTSTAAIVAGGALAVTGAAATTTPQTATKTKKKGKGNRHVFITERTRYLKHDVPSVDTVVEEDKLHKKLARAQEQHEWKLEAQVLLQLGQLMKWKGRVDEGDALLEQSAIVLRDHTFSDSDNDNDSDDLG